MSGHTKLRPYIAIQCQAALPVQHNAAIQTSTGPVDNSAQREDRVGDYAIEQPAWNRPIKWAALGLAAELFT
jgi:hypothetical protein